MASCGRLEIAFFDRAAHTGRVTNPPQDRILPHQVKEHHHTVEDLV
jgi:hypothetical protein